jgi:predicted ATPase/class 3 adenylate cyclase
MDDDQRVTQTLPVGTVTFLFSDIEGSTRLAQALGTDRWRTALEDHQRVWRTAFAAHAGTEITTEGDSFFAVFPSALDAVAAAADAQRGIAAGAWPPEAGPQGLRVRVGLHTGDGRLGGDSYVGVDVHRAARITAAANGGQTFLSATTRALTEASLPEGLTLVDLGRHRLKDLDQPEALSRLVIRGLADDSRPPRSLETPNNLPSSLTSFIGRTRELGEVVAMVRSARLVTLTGPGGTGKTRLALAASAALLDDFPDGVHFIRLAPISDPDLLAATIVGAIGLEQAPTADALTVLLGHLAERRVLLVLDNFEQIVAAAPLVSTLLAEAERLRVLVTSRETLHLHGEQELPIPPLGLPDPAGGQLDPAVLAESEAIALFVARARAIVPTFGIDKANAAAIVAICTSLDGLPLAIELAAARVKVLSPEAIRDRLRSSLGLLASADRDVTERQRTLRGAIAWSYDLLSPSEQALFRRAAIFVGGWSLEAAEAVCDPTGEQGTEVFEIVASLADKSLVRSEPGAGGEPRFRYLATIREYALEQLTASGERDSLALRHAQFFAGLAERMVEPLAGSDVVRWVDRLEADHDNLRSAVHWSIEAGEPGLGLRIMGFAWRFWYQGSHLGEGRAAIEELLRLPVAAPDRDRAIGLNGAGGIVYWLGDFDAADAYWTEALAINEALRDVSGTAEAHYNLGFIAMIRGDFTTQKEHHAKALAQYESIGDETGMINTQEGLVVSLLRAGDLAGGEELLTHTVAAQRARGHFVRLGEDLSLLATFQALAGHLDRARASMREALPVVDETGTLTSVASALSSAALIEAHDGHPERTATIAGALDAMTESSRVAIAQVDMLGLPTSADEARSRLDPEAFERAYQLGRTMDRSAIIAFTMAGLAEESAPDR